VSLSPRSRVITALLHFVAISAACFALLSALAYVELAFLLRKSATFRDPDRIKSIQLMNFSASGNGKLAVSEVLLDGGTITDQFRRELLIHDLETNQAPIRAGVMNLSPTAVVYSPSRDEIAFATADGHVYLAKARPAILSPLLVGRAGLAPSEVHVSEDGSVLAAHSCGQTHLWDLRTGAKLGMMVHDRPYVTGSVSIINNRTLAIINAYGVATWDVDLCALKSERRFDGLLSATLSPDGNLVAAFCHDGYVSMGSSTSTDELWRLRINSASECNIAFAPGGRQLAIGYKPMGLQGNAIAMFDIRSGLQHASFRTDADGVPQLSFGTDETLYAWTAQGRIYGWNVEQRRLRWSFDGIEWATKQSIGEAFPHARPMRWMPSQPTEEI
jgi:WD40 repeat protein